MFTRIFTLVCLLLTSFFLLGQDVGISPIIESPPLDQKAANRFRAFQTYRNWGIKMLGFDTLGMQRYAGRNVKVCICDTGTPNHNELKASLKGYAVFTGEASELDKNGHSTHVGGIVNEIAPMAEIYYAKVLSDNGSGSFVSVAKGIDWCISEGAHIINMSLGGRTPSQSMKDAIERAKGKSIVVAAVGNDGISQTDNIGYPARWEDVLAVGSIDQTYSVSRFSSSGTQGDLVAPGSSILSTWTDQTYRVLSGTSMATPFVTGVLALYLEAKSNEGSELTIEEFLEQNAIDLEPAGFDRYSFHGLLSNNIFKRVPSEPDTLENDEPSEPNEPSEPPTVEPMPIWEDWRFWAMIVLIVGSVVYSAIRRKNQ